MTLNRPPRTSPSWRPILILALLFALPAWAEASDRSFEITPTVGYRSGGDFDNDAFFDFSFDLEVEDSDSVGLTLGFGLSQNWILELLWDEQESVLVDQGFLFGPDLDLFDLTVTYAHVGIVHQWTPGHLRPFITFSAGYTDFDPAPSDLSSEARFSTSFGGGLKVMFNEHLGLRLEGRFFATFLEDNEDFYCQGPFDDCGLDEDYFFQSQARAGLVFAF